MRSSVPIVHPLPHTIGQSVTFGGSGGMATRRGLATRKSPMVGKTTFKRTAKKQPVLEEQESEVSKEEGTYTPHRRPPLPWGEMEHRLGGFMPV